MTGRALGAVGPPRGEGDMSNSKPERVRRRKRMGEEVRDEALTAARKLLLEGGPSAVTLANVGRAIGMTHANVLYRSEEHTSELQSLTRCTSAVFALKKKNNTQ